MEIEDPSHLVHGRTGSQPLGGDGYRCAILAARGAVRGSQRRKQRRYRHWKCSCSKLSLSIFARRLLGRCGEGGLSARCVLVPLSLTPPRRLSRRALWRWLLSPSVGKHSVHHGNDDCLSSLKMSEEQSRDRCSLVDGNDASIQSERDEESQKRPQQCGVSPHTVWAGKLSPVPLCLIYRNCTIVNGKRGLSAAPQPRSAVRNPNDLLFVNFPCAASLRDGQTARRFLILPIFGNEHEHQQPTATRRREIE